MEFETDLVSLLDISSNGSVKNGLGKWPLKLAIFSDGLEPI